MNPEVIHRLGFGAWAENIIVNYIEDYADVMKYSTGNHTIEREHYTINANWNDSTLSITVRAYVDGDGWQTLEQNIKIK